MSFEHSKT